MVGEAKVIFLLIKEAWRLGWRHPGSERLSCRWTPGLLSLLGQTGAQPHREQTSKGILTTALGGENRLSPPHMAELPTGVTKGH